MAESAKTLASILEEMAQTVGQMGIDLPDENQRMVSHLKTLTVDTRAAQQAAQTLTDQVSHMEEFVRTSALITSSLEIDVVLEEVIDTIITLTGTTRGYLLLYEESSQELEIRVARNWNHENLSEKEIGYSRSVVETVLQTHELLVTTNAQADRHLQNASSVLKYGLYVILCLPLVYRDQLVGIIYVDSSTNPANFKPSVVPLLTGFANQAVIAIENARLFDQVKADLARAQREIQRLHIREITTVSSNVLPKLVETIAHLLELPYAAIGLKHDDGFVPAAEYGTFVGDLLHMPLLYQAEVVGELRLSKPTNRDFSENDYYLLDEFIHQAGGVVHAVRLTTDLQRSHERLVTAREEERRRLRRDLHDGLGPTLATVTLMLDTARNLLNRDTQAVDTLLAELKVQVQAAITDIRRVVYELRPPALDELGLIPALREHIMQYNHQNALRILLVAPPQLPDLSAAIEVAAYRIVLEALTNVIRHAQAHNCRIHISASDVFCMEITDDGLGLPKNWRSGVGVTSMRERVMELGGDFVIEPLQPTGTRVYACLPFLPK